MLRSWLSIFGFRRIFILLAVAERDGGKLQGKARQVIWNKNWSPLRTYDLALCIDNNDNQMTFVVHIVYLCPS